MATTKFALSFSRLRDRSAHAEVAQVRSGPAPVGIAVVEQGGLVAVADSNRFSEGAGSIMLISRTFSKGRPPRVVGFIRSGDFPREVTVEPDGSLVVTDYGSRELQLVDLGAFIGG